MFCQQELHSRMLFSWGELLREKQAGIRQSDCER